MRAETAFGHDEDEFMQIALMPEPYIIYRRSHEMNGAGDWLSLYRRLGKNQRETFLEIVSRGRVGEQDVTREPPSRLRRILAHYVDSESKKG